MNNADLYSTNVTATNTATNNLLAGNATITDNLVVKGTTNLQEAATLDSSLNVAGATTLNSTLNVGGNSTIGGTLGVTGATTLNSTLNVAGATTLSSTLQAGATTLDSLTVINNATVGGTLAFDTFGTADNANFLCRNAFNQLSLCTVVGSGAAYVQGGNSFGATAVLGTNDNFGLDIRTNGTTVASLSNTGAALFKNSADSTTAFQIQNLAGTSNLFVANTTNSKIGVGMTPSAGGAVIQVGASANAQTPGVQFTNSTNGTASTAELRVANSSGSLGEFGIQSAANTGTYASNITGQYVFLRASAATAGVAFVNGSTQNWIFTNGNVEKLRIIGTNGHVLIGTTTDNTGLLQLAEGTTSASGIGFGSDTNLYRSAAAELTTNGNILLQGGSLLTNQTTANLFNTTATTINIGGAVGAGGIVLAGGSGSTGCTIDGSNGNLTCSGNITGAATGTVGYWTRGGTTLQPATAGDNILTSGNLQLTSDAATAASGIKFGSTGDTNLYRNAAGQLTLQAASSSSHLNLNATSGIAALGFETNGTRNFAFYKFSNGSSLRLWNDSLSTDQVLFANSGATTFNYAVTASGILNANATGKTAIQIADSGAQNSGITIGGDTNLYRSAADTLKTDDAFLVGGTLGVTGVSTFSALVDVASSVRATSNASPASGSGNELLFSAGTGILQAYDRTGSVYLPQRIIGSTVALGISGTDMLTLQADGKLAFGSALDTNLYRSAAGTLKTDGALIVGTLGSGTTALCSNAGQISTCSAGGGGTNFIVNGTSLQTSANFNIDGSGTFGGNLDLAVTSSITGQITQNGSLLIHTTGGTTNFFAGTNAGNLTLTGTYNTGIGNAALQSNTTGYQNTANGAYALNANTTGYYNTANGMGALQSNTTGYYNTANGMNALISNTTGYRNTAVGSAALQNNTTGIFNTAVGSTALQVNTTGNFNTAVGVAALNANTTGSNNAAIGYAALNFNTTGSNNAALGLIALSSNTTGSDNAALGYGALVFNTTGSNNAAIGYRAGYTNTPANANTTGSNNTFLGYQSGPGVASASNLQNSTAIGTYSVVNQNDSLVLGCVSGVNGCTATTFVGIDTATPANGLLTVGTNTTAASGGMYFGTDTNLYRSTTNTLKTDGNLSVAGLLYPTTIDLGNATVGVQNGILDFNQASRLVISSACGNCFAFGLTSTITGAAPALLLAPTFNTNGTGQTQYGERLIVTNAPTDANTIYGQEILMADAGTLANTTVGLSVNASTANPNDTQYAAIFQGGNVGIGTTSPVTPLAVMSNASSFGISQLGRASDNYSTLQFRSNNGSSIYYQLQAGPSDFNIMDGSSVSKIYVSGGVGIATTTLSSGILTVGTNTTAATGGMYFGTDTNLYRGAANLLQTDDAIKVGTNADLVTNPAITALGYSDTIPLLHLGDSTYGTGVYFDIQRTSSNAWNVNTGASYGGPLTFSGNLFSIQPVNANVGGNTTSLFNVGAATLTHDAGTVANYALNNFAGGTFASGGALTVTNAATVSIAGPPTAGAGATLTRSASLQLASDTGTAASGIGFGSTLDTNLYRSAASTLKTDQWLAAGAGLVTRPNTSAQVIVGDKSGDGVTPTITFGNALDTNLYRVGANFLKSDGSFTLGGELNVGGAASGLGWIRVKAASGSALAVQSLSNASYDYLNIDGGSGKIAWGDGAGVTDTKLSRSGAGALLLQGTANSATAFQVQDLSNNAVLIVSTNNFSGGANAANATLKLAQDSGTSRSINAAGSINASGADYAEYIPWSGAAPAQGSVVSYAGSSYVVSDPTTAAFVGNDKFSGGSILVTFAGQVPVRVSGPVAVGDILVDNGDGTAKAVSPSSATVSDYLGKLGIAQTSGTGGTVMAAIGTTAANVALNGSAPSSNVQSTSDFADLNVSGTATISTLQVTGTATIGTLHVTGNASFDGPTVSFSDNVRGINLPVSSGATSEDVTFGTAYPDTSYAVQCTPSYNTTCYITGKTTTGFTINFGTAPPDSQTVDWFVLR